MFDFLVRRGTIIILIFIFVLFACGWGLSKLSIDPNNRVFFNPNHPKYAELLRLESLFGANTVLLYVLSAPDGLKGSSELSRAIAWLTQNAWWVEGVRSVDSLASYPFVFEDQEGLNVLGALDYACDGGLCDPQKVDEISPAYLVNRLISADYRSAAVVAKVDLGNLSDQAVLSIASEANSLKEAFRYKFKDIDIYLTGGVPMMEAFFVAAGKDSSTLMPIALLLMLVVLGLFLGSLVNAFLLALLGIASVAITMGLAGWFGHTLNTATATAPLIIFTLVVAAAMHLFMHLSNGIGASDLGARISRVRAATTANAIPIVLTTLTTAVGFASMVFVSSPPMKQLGLMAAGGVVIGAVLSLVVMPAVFVRVPRITLARSLINLQDPLNRYAKWLERTRPSVLTAVVVMVICGAGITRISFDEDFVRYFAEGTSFREDTEEIAELMAGPYHIDVVYDSGEPGGIFSASAIRDVSAIARHFEADARVVSVFSFVDVLREVAEVFSPDAPLEQAESDQLAQYFLTYELSLDRGKTTLDFVDAGYRFARTSVLLRDVSMGEIRSLVESSEVWAQENFPSGGLTVTGEGVPTAYLSGESISEMSWGIVASMTISAILVGLFLRNAAVSLVVFLATLVPLLAGFGIWGWIGGEIGMAATLVIATTIGLVVDDTIHLAYRYLDGRENLDLTGWGAAAYSVHKTGPALVATSVALTVGFSVLLLSEFRMNSTFGICTSMIIGLALAFNLTVSPRLLTATT